MDRDLGRRACDGASRDGPQPTARAGSGQQRAEVRDAAVRRQQGALVVGRRKGDHGRSGSQSGLHPGRGVLEHDAVRGLDAEP